MYSALPSLHEQFMFSQSANDFIPKTSGSVLDEFYDIDAFICYCVNGLSFSKDANNDIGILYCLGISFEQNIEKGYKILIKASEMGSTEAYYNLALLDYFSIRPKGMLASGSFYKAAHNGIKVANYYIGRNEEANLKVIGNLTSDRSDAIMESEARASKYYKISADMNHIPSLIRLAEIYSVNLDLLDTAEAMKYCLKAADLGSVEGMIMAGKLFLSGYSPRVVNPVLQTPRGYIENHYNAWLCNSPEKIKELKEVIQKHTIDIDSAIRLFSAAQKLGSAIACKYLGDTYLEHFKDMNKAIEYFQIGMDKKNISCALSLAEIYENNEKYLDIDRAINCYSLCVDIFNNREKRSLYGIVEKNKAQSALKRLSHS